MEQQQKRLRIDGCWCLLIHINSFVVGYRLAAHSSQQTPINQWFVILFINLLLFSYLFHSVLAWLLSFAWGRMRKGAPEQERTGRACAAQPNKPPNQLILKSEWTKRMSGIKIDCLGGYGAEPICATTLHSRKEIPFLHRIQTVPILCTITLPTFVCPVFSGSLLNLYLHFRK